MRASSGAYAGPFAVNPCENTMSGKRRPCRAAAPCTGGLLGSPCAGYRTSVGRVRLGAPPNVRFGGVGRLVSTNVNERVPTAYGPLPARPSSARADPDPAAVVTMAAVTTNRIAITRRRKFDVFTPP